MLAALQKKDWKAFARLYNGPAYAQNRPAFSLIFIQYYFHFYFTNFTIQSIQIGFSVTTSINTFAGCMSSSAKRSEM